MGISPGDEAVKKPPNKSKGVQAEEVRSVRKDIHANPSLAKSVWPTLCD
jgi:hypothetical protein